MKQQPANWSIEKRILFRFSFVFFALHIIPLSGAFWSHVFAQNGNIFFTAFTALNYFPTVFGDGGYYDVRDFTFVASLALLISAAWGIIARNSESYDKLYQWSRIILRYKLASVLIAYAAVKIFPLQLPSPTLSDLNTEYGDFTKARIFELTVGIAKAHYQTAVGLTELLAAALLLFRRTATLGAIVASGTLLNVVLAAFAYHTGAEYYTLSLMLAAVFLIAHDIPAMYALLIERPAAPDTGSFELNERWSKARPIIKASFIVLSVVYLASVYTISGQSYLLPGSAGLKDASGLYDVSEFRLNNQLIPYSKTNPERWQDVVFENWNTLSISTAIKSSTEVRPVTAQLADENRNWESSGSGGRHYFSYTLDESGQQLRLKNKNSEHSSDIYSLQYSRPDTATIILSGTNKNGDSLYAVLKKIDKQYLLIKGRRKPVTL